MTGEFDFRGPTSPSTEVGPFRSPPRAVNHPVEAYASGSRPRPQRWSTRGDTGAGDALVELARGADLLLCEASFLERRRQPARPAPDRPRGGEHASAPACGRLRVTHLVPSVGRAREEASSADDGDRQLDGPVSPSTSTGGWSYEI